MKSSYKRYSLVGPGGFSCPCCGTQSGDKYKARARLLEKRQAKRREAKAVDKQVNIELTTNY
jgi:hypothetical protein